MSHLTYADSMDSSGPTSHAPRGTVTRLGLGVSTTRYPWARALIEKARIAPMGSRRSSGGVLGQFSGSYITVVTDFGIHPFLIHVSYVASFAHESAFG